MTWKIKKEKHKFSTEHGRITIEPLPENARLKIDLPANGKAVWCITSVFVNKDSRQMGHGLLLIKEAIRHVVEDVMDESVWVSSERAITIHKKELSAAGDIMIDSIRKAYPKAEVLGKLTLFTKEFNYSE